MQSVVDGVGRQSSLSLTSGAKDREEGEKMGTTFASCSEQGTQHALTSSRTVVFCAHFKSVYILPRAHFLLKFSKFTLYGLCYFYLKIFSIDTDPP